MEASSAAALYAGSIVLRKTFEAVAQRSLNSIFSSLRSRFRGQDQLQKLQQDLESRLRVLSLPVDMCIQHVLHGNTALQGALDMVILLINDIVSFQEELEAQSYNENIPKLSQNEAAKRLEGFLFRLDGILPYLALAVNAVSLLKTSEITLSPSRLMQASYLIRSAKDNHGEVMSTSAKLYRFETRLTLPRWQEKMLKCYAVVRQTPSISKSTDRQEFEVAIANENSSESDEEALVCIPIDKIAAMGSSTLHVLGLGEHNLEAVTLIDVEPESNQLVHFALQCVEEDDVKTSDSTDGKSHDSSSEEDGSSNEDAEKEQIGVCSTSRISKLGLLEYVLRLCMLQSREERNHWEISDERIQMFFSDPRYMSEPIANVHKTGSGSRAVDMYRVTPNQKKKPNDYVQQTPPSTSGAQLRQHSRRLSITEMFYDLRVESPAKVGKDGP